MSMNERHNRREGVAAGSKITFIAILVRQLGRVGFAVVLARFLGPVEFGVVAAASIYIGIVSVLLETTIGSSVVQAEHSSAELEGAVWWIGLTIGVGAGAFTFLASGWFADFVSVPAVAPIIAILSLSPILRGVGVLPQSILQRSLKFQALALVEIVAIVVGTIVALVSLAFGVSYWAVVVQQILIDLLLTLGFTFCAGRFRFRTNWYSLRTAGRFGLSVLASQSIGFVNRNADSVIISRYLGQFDLSLYSVPYRIMLVPVALLGSVANRICFPLFSRLQGDYPRLREVFHDVSAFLALTSVMPMAVLAVVAQPLITLVFDERWLGSVPIMQALAVTAILQTLATLGGAIFMAAGRATLLVAWSVVSVIANIGGFVLGLHLGGSIGVAVGYTLTTLLVTPFLMRSVCREAGTSLGLWLRVIHPYLVAGGACTVAAWIAGHTVSAYGSLWLELVVCSVAGAIAYGGLLIAIWPTEVKRMQVLLRSLLWSRL